MLAYPLVCTLRRFAQSQLVLNSAEYVQAGSLAVSIYKMLIGIYTYITCVFGVGVERAKSKLGRDFIPFIAGTYIVVT